MTLLINSTPVLGTPLKGPSILDFLRKKFPQSLVGSVLGQLPEGFVFEKRRMTKEERKINSARLVIPNENSKDQRWIIKMYVYNADLDKNVLIKKHFPKTEDSYEKNLAEAQKKVAVWNSLLSQGYHINRLKIELDRQDHFEKTKKKITFQEAEKLFYESKQTLRPKTQNLYKYYIGYFMKYIRQRRIFEASVLLANEELISDYFEKIAKTYSNRTLNNFRTSLFTFFNYLQEKKHITQNPISVVKPFKKSMGKNIAYTEGQMKSILKHLDKEMPELAFVCRFMFYTLIRPNELCHLKVKDIKTDKIYLNADFSKNGHERYITIPAQLERIFQELEIRKLPEEYYLISYGLKPGPKIYASKNITDIYTYRVLKKLKFPSGYTLYSWKHSGVIALYRAGISKASIRMQLGHVNSESFDIYLKSLGLFENTEIANNYPSLDN